MTVRSRPIWTVIAAMAVLTVPAFLMTGLRVDPLSHPYLPVPFVLLGAVWWFYRAIRPDPRVRALALSFIQITLILLFGTLLSYAAAALRFPLQDANLLAIDKALGIDRRLYIDFFAQQRWLHNAVVLAYFTLMPQYVLVPAALFLANQMHRLQQLTLAIAISLFATVVISAFTPALSAAYLDTGLPVGAALPPHIAPWIPVLEKLRTGMPYLIHLNQLEGVIAFPSFHTIGALLFIWATWNIAVVRWISLVLNAALIAATPIVGTHYFIDIAAGGVVALAAIAAAHRLSRTVSAEQPVAAAKPQRAALLPAE